MSKEKLVEFYKKFIIEINCVIIAIIFAISVIAIGFFKTLFIIICAGLGLYIGIKFKNDRKIFSNIFDRILKFFKI